MMIVIWQSQKRGCGLSLSYNVRMVTYGVLISFDHCQPLHLQAHLSNHRELPLSPSCHSIPDKVLYDVYGTIQMEWVLTASKSFAHVELDSKGAGHRFRTASVGLIRTLVDRKNCICFSVISLTILTGTKKLR